MVSIGELSRLSGFSERSLRRAIERIGAAGSDLQAQQGQASGADLPLFLATLYDLATHYPDGKPPIHEHYRALRAHPEKVPPLPERYTALLGTPEQSISRQESNDPPPVHPGDDPLRDRPAAVHPGHDQGDELARLREDLARLELRLTHLEARFASAERGLRSVELLLEDEEAEGSLYALVTGLLGVFNDRLGAVERGLAGAVQDMAAITLKLADNDKHVRVLLSDLIRELSPR